VANSCRFLDQDVKSLFTFGDKKQYATGRYADPQVFSRFTLPFFKAIRTILSPSYIPSC